eukprot:UN34086
MCGSSPNCGNDFCCSKENCTDAMVEPWLRPCYFADDDCYNKQCPFSPNRGDLIHGEMCEGDNAAFMGEHFQNMYKTCDATKWPDLLEICGDCKVFVGRFWEYNFNCDEYCDSIGRDCVAAYEELSDTCRIESEWECDEVIYGGTGGPTSDAICECTPRDTPYSNMHFSMIGNLGMDMNYSPPGIDSDLNNCGEYDVYEKVCSTTLFRMKFNTSRCVAEGIELSDIKFYDYNYEEVHPVFMNAVDAKTSFNASYRNLMKEDSTHQCSLVPLPGDACITSFSSGHDFKTSEFGFTYIYQDNGEWPDCGDWPQHEDEEGWICESDEPEHDKIDNCMFLNDCGFYFSLF